MIIDEKYLREISNYVLSKTGIQYFRRIKANGSSSIMVSCPYHKGGQEENPSMGIKLTTDEKGSIGTCHCFACKVKTILPEMVRYMLGDKYNEDEVEARFNLQTNIARETILQEQNNMYVKFQQPNTEEYCDENMLREFRTYHMYLAGRHISRETAQKYDIGYDKYNNHITFPIRDIYRRYVGLGRRAITEKQYIYPYGFEKPLYGVYELPMFVRHIWVVEGPFNLWSLNEYGKTGVALLGTGTLKQYKELLTLSCVDYVLALDGDDAGRKGISKLGNYLIKHNKKVFVADVPNNKDINDMTPEQFHNMNILTFSEWKYKYKY